MTRKELSTDLKTHFAAFAAKFGIQTTVIAADPADALARVIALKSGGQLVVSYEGQDRETDESARAVAVATRFALWVCRGGNDLAAPGATTGTTLDEICEELEREVIRYAVPNNEAGECADYAIYDSTRIVTAPEGFPLACYKIAFQFKRGII